MIKFFQTNLNSLIFVVLTGLFSFWGNHHLSNENHKQQLTDADTSKAADFKSLVDSMSGTLGRSDDTEFREQAKEFRRRMDAKTYDRALHLDTLEGENADFGALVRVVVDGVDNYLFLAQKQDELDRDHKAGCYVNYFPALAVRVPLQKLQDRLSEREIWGKQ